MSLGEIVLLLLVGIIVVGPRNLPTMMRTAGQMVARLRRMSMELRSQSGIDDVLKREGLDEHLHELRSLTRLNVVETLIAPVAAPAAGPYPTPSTGTLPQTAAAVDWKRTEPLREREYPLIGCDSYDALPDDATPYRIPQKDRTPAPPAEDATAKADDGADAAPKAEEPKPEAAVKTDETKPDAAAEAAPAAEGAAS